MLQPLRSYSLQDDSVALAPGFPIKFSGAETEYRPTVLPRANNEDIFRGLLQLSPSENRGVKESGRDLGHLLRKNTVIRA